MEKIKVGFIGLGNMGGGMSMNIAKAGYDMVVHDINKAAATNLLELGAEWAGSPKELAQSSDVIFTSLPGPVEVEAVSIGNEGLIKGVSNGSIWIDLSTSSPTLIRELSEEFEKQGTSVLDAPVSGGV